MAAYNGHDEVSKALVSAKADLAAKITDGAVLSSAFDAVQVGQFALLGFRLSLEGFDCCVMCIFVIVERVG